MERTIATTETGNKSPLEVRKSPIAGRGCFATEVIHKGETIRTLVGEKVNGLELDERIALGEFTLGMDLQINDNLFLILGSPDVYFNHSCAPNAAIRGENELFAIGDIAEGEEITFDYSTTIGINREPEWLFDNEDWSMQCSCRADDCRGQVESFLSIPQKNLQRYLELGALPNFITNKLVSSPEQELVKV